MEPLPFRAMKSYPYAEGETYPIRLSCAGIAPSG